MTSGLFDFEMRVTDKDRSGYYYPNWDNAVRITVRAENRAAAFEQAWAVMGDSPRGRDWTWAARIDRIVPTAPDDLGVGGS